MFLLSSFTPVQVKSIHAARLNRGVILLPELVGILAMSLTKIAPAILLLLFCPAASSQTGNERSYANSYRGVTLSVLSQRWIPRNEVPYIGDDVIDFSDMIVRFRLENRGRENIYYLADNALSSIEPVGFQLFRQRREAEWQGTYSPARGREGIFTGDGVHWLLLPPGSAIEFERRDSSIKRGEHATSVYLNTEAEHNNRVELISNPYRPLRRLRSQR